MPPRCVSVGLKGESQMVAIVPRSGHVRVMIGLQSVVHVVNESKAFLASFATPSENSTQMWPASVESVTSSCVGTIKVE